MIYRDCLIQSSIHGLCSGFQFGAIKNKASVKFLCKSLCGHTDFPFSWINN